MDYHLHFTEEKTESSYIAPRSSRLQRHIHDGLAAGPHLLYCPSCTQHQNQGSHKIHKKYIFPTVSGPNLNGYKDE